MQNKVVGTVNVPRKIFAGSIAELMDVVKSGGRGDVTSLCSLMPQHGFCRLKKAHLPHALTPFNTVPLNAEIVLLRCGMDCGDVCNSGRFRVQS